MFLKMSRVISFWVKVWGQPIKAVAQRCSLKEVFSIFLQNSQENSPWLHNFIKKLTATFTAFIIITWNTKLLSFSFGLLFCLFIDHLVIFCPTFQVITIMQIHFDSYPVFTSLCHWISCHSWFSFFNPWADIRGRKNRKTPANVLSVV